MNGTNKYLQTHSMNGTNTYYKIKLELKSNSSEILPVKCNFICVLLQLKMTKLKLKVRSLSLNFSTKRKDKNTDKLAINLKNFAQIRLQLKFA